MSRTGDPDETVVLPVVPPSGDPDQTMVLPVTPGHAPQHAGQHSPQHAGQHSPQHAAPHGAAYAAPYTSATAQPDPVASPAEEVEAAQTAPGPDTPAPQPTASPQTAPGTPATEGRSVARNSAVMAAGSVVSRLTGFLRAAAISAALGAGLVADDYQLAVTLPNMVFELLVGGVLASVIVPVLVRTRKKDPDGGLAYAQRLLTLAILALGVATAMAVLAAPVFTELLSSVKTTDADKELITRLARLILPAIFFYGMAALIAAVLNSRGHFAAPMWTPILNNLVVITTAGVFILVTGGDAVRPESVSTAQLLVLGLGTMCGIVVQAAGLLPALRRAGFRWKLRFDFRALGLGELAPLAAWMLLFVVVSQAGLFVVMAIAKDVGTQGAAGVAVFQNAFLIFMMAHGIVAVSVLTALMPRLSAAAADGRTTTSSAR